MLLERTITQLNIGSTTPERAMELGQLGYLQWLGALPIMAGYAQEARRAHAMAIPFASTSPAVAIFCDLLNASLRTPIEPLPLNLPSRQRRGGAKARRAAS
ncbi:MAG: hypothetical protein AAF217_15810 [Pseudomonadota bacterium]